MDDIEVKAETAALYGAELETPERIDDTGAPLAAPATTPTGATASTDGIMISNVVSMATMKPEEVVLPDVVGSAMHAVVDLEPGEMPAAETSEGSAVHAVVEHDETPASSSSVATTSGSSIDAVDQDPHAAPPNPIAAAEGAVSDCGVAVAGKVVGVIPSKGSPEVVQTEQAPSPEIVDLTEDQSSLSPSPTPAKTETEDIEANGADKTTTDLPQAVPEALPLNDAKLAAENGSSNADTTLVATADSTGCELKDFRGWRDHHIEMAKKKSDNFANFLRKFENKLEGGKRRRTRKSRSNIIRVRKDELSSHWTILSGKRPWYDGCQYRCGFCNLTVSQTHTLRNHVRGQHGRAFSFRDHQTLKQAQWKCRVCTFIFMREKAVIQQHLEESHGLTIQTYEARKRRRRKKSGGGSGDDDGEEGALGCNTSDEGNFDEEVINEPSNEKKGVNNDGFENAVGYGNNNRERSTFKIHFQNPLSTDAKPKGDASVSESKVSQYEAKRDIEPKEPMDRSIHYANRKGHKVVNLSQIQTSGNPENASSPTKKSTIADSRAEPKVVSTEGGTAKSNNYQEVRVKEEVTDGRPWFDGCTFQCPSCPALFRLTSSIVKHMSRIHGTSFVRSNVELAEVTYWRCEICQGATFMKRKRFDIKYHLNLQHDMSLSEYEKKFLLNTHDTAEQALDDDASKHKEMESASGSKKSETPVKIALKSARDGDDGGNERRGKRAGHEKGASNDAEKKCDDCGRAFKSRAGLCAHKRFCPSLKCDDCGQMFVAKGALASHKRMHMERPGAHKCGSCAKTFGCRSDVQKHVLDCPGRPRKRADAGAPKGNGVDKGIMRKDSYKHTSAPPLNTAVLMPNMRSHRQKQKDVNDGSIRNSNDDGNNEKKKSEPPAMDKKAKGDSSASKENKSRQSKYVANGGIEPKKHMDRSTLYVNREGHQVTSLPQSRAMNQPKRTGLEKNSDPYPRRSSARSAGKKISNIIKEIMEKDEDGVCAMDKTGQTPETKMLKSMSARSLKETAEETVKEALKDTPKGAKAFLPLEASANAGKDATKTSAKDVKEAPAVNNESEKRPLGKAGSKLRYPTHSLEASDNRANESNPDVHASAANTIGEKQKLIGPNGKIVVKRELDEKQKVTANKKLKLGETMAESGPEPAPKRAKASKGRDKWWDGCKYRCPRCPTEFSDSAAVKLHVECYHGVESSDIEKCGAVTIFYTEWSCSMCAAAPIPRQRSTVAKHLREAHSLTVDAYERAQAKMV